MLLLAFLSCWSVFPLSTAFHGMEYSEAYSENSKASIYCPINVVDTR